MAFMQTQRMCVDLPFQISLDKHNRKKIAMQTQKIYVHLNYTVGLVKHNKKKSLTKLKECVFI